ncbi:MAG: SDR family NAD(P)-dependent oxidoreductase [Leucobacter sp.]
MNKPATVSTDWAIVTGGCGGIGLSTAKALVAEGYRVLALDQQVQDLSSSHVEVAQCNVQNRLSVRETLANVLGDDTVSVLVNSAGVYRPDSFAEATDSDFDLMFGVNVKGTFVVSQEVLKYMTSGASIVNISSVAAHNSTEENPVYGATKGAISAMTRGMAVSLAEAGIRVNAVAPGPINTPMGMNAAADPVYRDRMLARVSSRRFAEPEDVVYAILALIDPRASYITGHELPVDGGVLAKR